MKDKINLGIYDVTTSLTSNCNTHIVTHNISRNRANQKMKFGQLIEYNIRKHCNCNTHIVTHNISRNRANQKMKFGQLIEYNIRKNFLGKSYILCGVETVSRSFSEKSKLSLSLDQQSKILYIFFYCMPS